MVFVILPSVAAFSEAQSPSDYRLGDGGALVPHEPEQEAIREA